LLTKGEPLKAQRTLGKLRGWPSHETGSSREFREMIAYTSTVVHDDDDIETGRSLTQPNYYTRSVKTSTIKYNLLLKYLVKNVDSLI